MFYRSASLYHPQRRAILHLKSQKRKIKEKNKSKEDKQPFLPHSALWEKPKWVRPKEWHYFQPGYAV